MEDIKAFLKSPLAKKIMIGLAILVVIYVAYLQYQKAIYNGMTKSGIINSIATIIATERIAHIKATDHNAVNGTYPMADILVWYDENQPPNITESRIKTELAKMGVDYVKHPEIAKIKTQVDNASFLVMYL